MADGLPAPPLGQAGGPLAVNAALVRDLERLVGGGHVSAEAGERRQAARDMWPKAFLWEREGRAPLPPEVVVWPGSAGEVAEVARFAAARAIPLTPHGAGSGVCGGAIPVNGGITMRFDRLAEIQRIDREALEVEAQVGVLGVDLEEALGRRGLTLGHFPSSIGCSSLGGWLAARSAGQSSSRYGKIEDMVLEATAVLGTGEIIRPRRPARGIDRLELLLGSEGTLAIFTDARLRLWPAPQVQLPGGYRFPSLEAGLEAMEALFHAGLRPSVARLYDPIDSVIAFWQGDRRPRGGTRPPPGLEALRPDPAARRTELARLGDGLLDLALGRSALLNRMAAMARASLLILVHEGSWGEAEPEAAEARRICEARGGRWLGEGPGRRWLRERYSISYKLPRVFEAGAWADTFEVATSWSRVTGLFRAVRNAVSPHALVMAHFSHAYADGCSIYFTFTGRARRPGEGLVGYDAAWIGALRAAAEAGATITHHHGVGLFKAPWLEEELGEGGMSLLRGLKAACDPAGILNPGKLGLGAGPRAPEPNGAAPGPPLAGGGGPTARTARPADSDPDDHEDHRVRDVEGTGAHEMSPSGGRGSDEAEIDPVDPSSMWIRASARAKVERIELRLASADLTLGAQPPSVFRGSVADWLEGPLAGRRVEDGRLGPGVASIEVALPNGFLFASRPAPRSAAGPAVEQLILGGGGEQGRLIAATLKAGPIPKKIVRLGLRGRPAPLARLLILLSQTHHPPLEASFLAPDPGEGELLGAFALRGGSPPLAAAIGRALAAARALELVSCDPPPPPIERAPMERELEPPEWILALEALRPAMRIRFCRIARESAIAVEEGTQPP